MSIVASIVVFDWGFYGFYGFACRELKEGENGEKHKTGQTQRGWHNLLNKWGAYLCNGSVQGNYQALTVIGLADIHTEMEKEDKNEVKMKLLAEPESRRIETDRQDLQINNWPFKQNWLTKKYVNGTGFPSVQGEGLRTSNGDGTVVTPVS